jgi:Uncharacterized protein conserved in bacteria (DUF2125)
MKQWTFATSTAVAALMIGQAAFADVTPEEVWQNMQDLSASAGQTMTAESAVRDGDTLVVTNLAVTFDDGKGVTVNGTMPEINFTDNGDGSVDVTMADTYPLVMTFPAKDAGKAGTMTIDVSQPGLVVTVSGTPAETSYDFNAPTMDVKLAASEEGAAAPLFNADIVLTNAVGGYLVTGETDAKTLESNLTADSMAVTVDGADANASSTFKMAMTLADLSSDTSGTFLGAEAMTNMAQAMKDGFALDSAITYGAMKLDVDATDAAGVATKIATTAKSGGFNVAMSADGLDYGVDSKEVVMAITGGQMPFPELKVGFGDAAFNLTMPVSAGEEPADFALLTKLVDFTISDEVWAMVDPTNQLPRDPATIVIDTTGTAKLTVDIMDEAAMAAMGEAPPGELDSLEIKELKASVAGAEFTGTGSFTFDNTDMTTFQGMPAPTGKLDVKLTGGNGLLDKLTAMGLLPEEQVMSVRMMMGMFATPATDGSDSLTSTVEFKDKGLFVNGQQLQ